MNSFRCPLILSVSVALLLNHAKAESPITQLSELPSFFFTERAAGWIAGEDVNFFSDRFVRSSSYWSTVVGVGKGSSWIKEHRFVGVVRKSIRRTGLTATSIFVLAGAERGKVVEFQRAEPEGSSGLPAELPVVGVLDDAGSVVCVLCIGVFEFVSLDDGINVVFDPSYNDGNFVDYGGVMSLSRLSIITTHIDDYHLSGCRGDLVLHRSGKGLAVGVPYDGSWTDRHGGAGGPDPEDTGFKPSKALTESKAEFVRWAKEAGSPLAATEKNKVWISSGIFAFEYDTAAIEIEKRAAQPGETDLTGRSYRVHGVADNDSLNLRTLPSSGALVITKLKSNAKGLRMLSSQPLHNDDGDWAFVSYQRMIGWAKFKYLQPVEP